MKLPVGYIAFSLLALLGTLAATFGLMHLASSSISQLFQSFYPLAYLFFFALTYGLVTATYLRVLTRLRPLKEGIYDLHHPQFVLWIHCTVFGEFARIALMPVNNIVFRPLYYRILGAKVGRNVGMGKTRITDPLLTTIEDHSIIGDASILSAHGILYNKFFMKRVAVGKGATVGAQAVISPGVEVGQNSVVGVKARVERGP